MAIFRDFSDIELDSLSDEELIAQIRAAREVGEAAAERRARQILVHRHHREVELRARLKASDDVAAEIADDVILTALEMEHRGESIGELRSLLRTLLQRRIADYYRKRRLETIPLAEEHEGDDELGRSGIVTVPGHEESVLGSVFFDAVLAKLPAVHRRVIVRNLLDRDTARETAELVNEEFADELEQPMTEANVHQIASRFRKELRREVEEGGGL